MDDDLILRKDDALLWWVILLVGIHSCILGTVMLTAPRQVLTTFGFPPTPSVFFPSQSGIFLLILGACYLRALSVPSFVWTILMSKTLAVLFLVTHVLFLDAPPIIAAALAGDATMLAAVALLAARRRRRRAAAPAS